MQDKRSKENKDPIPESFDSYEEAVEFWENHDPTDYPEHMTPVEVTFEKPKSMMYHISLDKDIEKKILNKAKKKGITATKYANELMRQSIS